LRNATTTALLLLLTFASIGCAVGGHEVLDPDGPGGRADDPSDRSADLGQVRSFHDDPRFVLRHRLDVAGTRDHRVTLTEQPFSHRSQKWHVFPFTSYGAARFEVELSVDDPRMHERSEVWVYGPRRSDGTWGDARRAPTAGGRATISVESTEYANWAVVVGPRRIDGFLPRYPGHKAIFQPQDEDADEVEGYIVVESPDRVFLELEDGRRERIHEPLTARDAGGEIDPMAEIWTEAENGELTAYFPNEWARTSWYVEANGDGETLQLGLLNEEYEGHFQILRQRDGGDSTFDEYTVIASYGPNGAPSDDPVILDVVQRNDGDEELDVIDDPNCDRRTRQHCRMPVYISREDGTHPPAPDHLLFSFKNTFIDFDETSTYGIAIACSGTCAPPPAARTRSGITPVALERPLRHPLYLAHGFNSNGDVFTPLVEMLRADPRWDGWVRAASVPGFEPLEQRTEQLRRNLAAYLRDLEASGVMPAPGDSYLRLNVIAHSMGGLDTRYLVGHERYNGSECHTRRECTAADGTPEACCAADASGRAIPWSSRIAALTTMSTPHCGSSFASWGLRRLDGRLLGWAFEKAMKKIFGLAPDTDGARLRATLRSLSQEFCSEVMTPDFPAPDPDRIYDWACMTGQERCEGPGRSIAAGSIAAGDAPRADPDRPGRFLLPAPGDRPTVFAWTSQSCITGSCGDTITPSLMFSFAVVHAEEGANDGLVAIDSGRFGIFMGLRNNDHFGWTTLEGRTPGFLGRLFGAKPEPASRWYEYWLDELRLAGY
jgi:hypothetical protein